MKAAFEADQTTDQQGANDTKGHYRQFVIHRWLSSYGAWVVATTGSLDLGIKSPGGWPICKADEGVRVWPPCFFPNFHGDDSQPSSETATNHGCPGGARQRPLRRGFRAPMHALTRGWPKPDFRRRK